MYQGARMKGGGNRPELGVYQGVVVENQRL